MPGIDLRPATDEIARLLDGVPEGALAAPTPCDYPVAALLDHLLGLSLAFTWAAEKSTPPDAGPPPVPTGAALDPEWRTELPVRLAALAQAWRAPSAWEGMTAVGGLTLPGEVGGVVALDELVLHGWDLARSTGQEFRADPAHVPVVLEFAKSSAAPEDAASRQGLFGPPVPVPDDAPLLDRALGFAGRDPHWTP